MKYTLLPDGAVSTRYEMKKLLLDKRVVSEVAICGGGIALMEGMPALRVNEDVEVNEDELREFVEQNFNEPEKAYKRIHALACPNHHYATIF